MVWFFWQNVNNCGWKYLTSAIKIQTLRKRPVLHSQWQLMSVVKTKTSDFVLVAYISRNSGLEKSWMWNFNGNTTYTDTDTEPTHSNGQLEDVRR